jgi:hypothetical protein
MDLFFAQRFISLSTEKINTADSAQSMEDTKLI